MDPIKKVLTSYPQIIAAVQFGSSVSGDTYEGSDIDLLVVAKSKPEKLRQEIHRKLSYKYQIHVYDKEEFVDLVKKGDPLSLSIVHRGKVLLNEEFIRPLRHFQPNEYSVKKCMLNSFAALGLGISDTIIGLTGDALNTIYHAARSSVWATLMHKEITPPNRRVFELLEDEEMKKQYQEIVSFRNKSLPHLSIEDSKVWEQGNNNAFTEYLAKSCSIIKKNYRQIFRKNFIDIFELLNLLKSKYDKPDFYSVMLSVNWEEMSPHYLVSLSHKDNSVLLFIDVHNGKIKELRDHPSNNSKK